MTVTPSFPALRLGSSGPVASVNGDEPSGAPRFGMMHLRAFGGGIIAWVMIAGQYGPGSVISPGVIYEGNDHFLLNDSDASLEYLGDSGNSYLVTANIGIDLSASATPLADQYIGAVIGVNFDAMDMATEGGNAAELGAMFQFCKGSEGGEPSLTYGLNLITRRLIYPEPGDIISALVGSDEDQLTATAFTLDILQVSA